MSAAPHRYPAGGGLFMACALCVLLFGCGLAGPEPAEPTAGVALDVPPGFAPPPVPDHNPLTPARVALGEVLFFDPILSGDGTVSCATCHDPARAFTDGLPRSRGVGGRTALRNSPSLLNVAYQRVLFWDGGAFTLEAQSLAPLENPDEMDAPLGAVIERLQTHPTYPARFEAAFDEGPSVRTLTHALAAFERTLLSTGSAYDRFLAGDSTALTPSARRGRTLFEGRAGCVQCHNGFLFTNQAFAHNGLTPTATDSGRDRITLDPADRGRFKVPSLRNVARTAPYMHDGRLPTLEAVLDHYDAGGAGVPGQSPLVRPLGLTTQERADLIALLTAMTDE